MQIQTNDTVVSVRVFESTVVGYEGFYTQYTILSSGTVLVTQIATRNNMARLMQSPYQHRSDCNSVAAAETFVAALVENRKDDMKEILS